MKHVLAPVAHVLFAFLVGSMAIPQGFAQPSVSASQEPSYQAPALPAQAQQQPLDEGELGTSHDLVKDEDRTAIPGGNQEEERSTETAGPWLDPNKPGAMHTAEAPIRPYAIVNFEAMSRLKRKPTGKPIILEAPEPSGEEELFKNRNQLVGTDRGPPPVNSIVSLDMMKMDNSSVFGRGSGASRQASARGGWVTVGYTSNDNANKFGYFSGPSDMALCAGSGFVLQAVNVGAKIYNAADGKLLSGPLSFFDLFQQQDSYGAGIFDPRCIYDGFNKRFIALAARKGGNVGSNYYSNILLGVSTTNDPRKNWRLYSVDATTLNSPCSPGDPCWCDFPTLGQDRYGIWINCNMWRVKNGWIGGKIWALGKQNLMNGGTVVPQSYYNINPNTGWFKPAITQGQGADNTANGGTMYIASTYGSGALALFTITNTQLLSNNQAPSFPSAKIVGTQSLQDKVDVKMRDGTPAGTGLGDISMTAYINGRLFMMTTCGVNINGRTYNGLAWYVLNANQGTVIKQGTVAQEGFDLYNPAVTGNEQGNMAFVTCVSGPYVVGIASLKGSIDLNTGAVSNLNFHVGNPNVLPYPIQSQDSYRSGDYSAINYSDDGFVYGSTEITYQSGGGGYFQWGTSIWGRMSITS